MTFEDLIDDKSRDKLYGIIEARKQVEHEEWLKRQAIERKYIEDTHFKNKEEIVLYLVLKGMNEISSNIKEVVDNKSDSASEVEKYYQICHILAEWRWQICWKRRTT